MTPLLLALVVSCAPPCKAELPVLFEKSFTPAPSKPALPSLLREKSFTCATLAEAVNHYVDLGEEAAIKELEFLTSDWMTRDKITSVTGDFSRKERIGWVCRILFQQGKNPLRPPLYGAVCSLPWNSMPLTTWPLFPVAASGRSYFVLGEGYLLAGEPEDPTAYLRYCRIHGKFRTEHVPIPTRDQALDNLNQLRQSKAWKAIKWSDTCEWGSYTLSEEWTWRFIEAQAENIPAW
jgi:hypothetical protein